MNSEEQKQCSVNNDAFKQAALTLANSGYSDPYYKVGNPLSLLAGEPIHVHFSFVGPMGRDPGKIIQVREIFEHARLGFSLSDHGGYLSITHDGIAENINIIKLGIDVKNIKSVSGFNLYSDKGEGIVLVGIVRPLTVLSVEEARELAEALRQAAQEAEGTTPTSS
jgi:hypothetical protein